MQLAKQAAVAGMVVVTMAVVRRVTVAMAIGVRAMAVMVEAAMVLVALVVAALVVELKVVEARLAAMMSTLARTAIGSSRVLMARCSAELTMARAKVPPRLLSLVFSSGESV